MTHLVAPECGAKLARSIAFPEPPFRVAPGGGSMITAIVRYRLPRHIGRAACRDHYKMIAPGFRTAKGLISKHFIWSESGVAGGVYQWQSLRDAKKFYAGPWREGIVERYGTEPEIEFYT